MTTRPGDWVNRARKTFDPAFLPWTPESIHRNGLAPSIAETERLIAKKEKYRDYMRGVLKTYPAGYWEIEATQKIIMDTKAEIQFLRERLEELYELRSEAEQVATPMPRRTFSLNVYPSARAQMARAAANRARAKARLQLTAFRAAQAAKAALAKRIAANRAAAQLKLAIFRRNQSLGYARRPPPVKRFVPRTTTLVAFPKKRPAFRSYKTWVVGSRSRYGLV